MFGNTNAYKQLQSLMQVQNGTEPQSTGFQVLSLMNLESRK